MKLYRIRDWDSIYENNRTRELKSLLWVPVPNNHDGDGYTLLTSHKDGAALFGAWVACVQVASRCDPRGTLLRRIGLPHDATSLSRITRLPESIFERVLSVATVECKWLTVEDFTEIPQDGAILPQASAEIPQEGALNGREGREGKGRAASAALRTRFERPTVEMMRLHAAKIGLPETEADKCWNYYESKGWLVGRSPMKSWPSAMVNWRSNWQERSNGHAAPPGESKQDRDARWLREAIG